MHLHERQRANRRASDTKIGVWVPVLLVVALAPYLSGCVDLTEAAPGTVSIAVVPDETTSGNLFSNQTLRATASVEAGHVYEIAARLVVTLGTIGTGTIQGVVSGAPLAEPVTFAVSTTGEGPLEEQSGQTFVAQNTGEVIVTIDFPESGAGSTVSDALQSLRSFVNGPLRGVYVLLLSDRGFDDNGTSPDDAVALPTDATGERTGTLGPGDEADYFLLELITGATYHVSLEATGSVSLALGAEDRFDQVNFGVPSPGGLSIAVSASAGIPGSSDFTAPATEAVFLRLSPSGALSPDDASIQYALSVLEIVP